MSGSGKHSTHGIDGNVFCCFGDTASKEEIKKMLAGTQGRVVGTEKRGAAAAACMTAIDGLFFRSQVVGHFRSSSRQVLTFESKWGLSILQCLKDDSILTERGEADSWYKDNGTIASFGLHVSSKGTGPSKKHERDQNCKNTKDMRDREMIMYELQSKRLSRFIGLGSG
ncbi:uncharacterized protein BT62DRAFT_923022 [Guyanagaster necrorhizus]|uniref:Uncharacterized protein n=1 Tax=Guyanagaster necrorhizus TaxID=856835 RepID=A0A9P7VK27_9AGAR|nr:uncharacterized protein BT62DRAFT_923022 [Guyanagaster necrorhizus MCA 3950]KAG7441780.1 hypothetical protein BT62DRAFT_923022 [Guyanagaster necrorhizus MCA 3950]